MPYLEKKVKILVEYLMLKIIKKSLTAEMWCSIWQFFQFAVVGLSNTIINYLVYFILILFNVHYIIANVVGFFVSVLNAFYWNNKYVFKEEDNKKHSILKKFFKVLIAYAGTGLLFNNILLVLWIEILGMNEMIAPIISLLITIPLNFIINKFWAFAAAKNN